MIWFMPRWKVDDAYLTDCKHDLEIGGKMQSNIKYYSGRVQW